MKFEHFALNVPDPRAMARWYIAQCGMTAARAMEGAPYTHFLADSTGRVVMEIYSNPVCATPDYARQHPLIFHVAFAVKNAGAERDRLVKAGATVVSDDRLPDGSHLVMLRDPWGVALQLCQRAKEM